MVVISAAQYEELVRRRQSFKEFLMSGPSFEGLDLSRDQGSMRDIEL